MKELVQSLMRSSTSKHFIYSSSGRPAAVAVADQQQRQTSSSSRPPAAVDRRYCFFCRACTSNMVPPAAVPQPSRYIVDRSKQHRRLEIIYSLGELNEVWGECLKKLSSLEELSLCRTHFSPANIEAAGRFCPLLKTLKVNYYYVGDDDKLAAAIGKNLPELRHLELIGDGITDVGLEAILDGCRHLESLDLRRCIWIDFEGDLGKRCSEQIKHLKLPGCTLEFMLLSQNRSSTMQYLMVQWQF